MRKLFAALLLCSCSAPTVEVISPSTTQSIATKTTQVVQVPTTSQSQIAATAPKESVSIETLVKNALRKDNPCGQWLDLALSVGWSLDLWPQQAYVIWRESRCMFDAHYLADPNGGSRGLMQINGFWCQKWLQQQSILETCDQLFDPKINLQASWAIYNYSVGKNKNGWNPWGMRSDFVPPSVTG